MANIISKAAVKIRLANSVLISSAVALSIVNSALFITDLSRIVALSDNLNKIKMAAVTSSLPVAYFNFDEPLGSPVINNIATGKTDNVYYFGGNANGEGRTTSGAKSRAITFNGFRSYVAIGQTTPIPYSQNMSISYWFKLDKAPSAMTDFSTGNPITYPTMFNKVGSYQHYFNRLNNTLVIKWWDKAGVIHDSREANLANNSKTAFTDTNKWYNVVWVFDWINKKMNLYVNNALESSVNITAELASATSPLTLSSFNNSIIGTVDEIKFYNRALSATEVTKIFQSNSCLSFVPLGKMAQADLALSVDCMNICNTNNDFTSEKNNCVKKSCEQKLMGRPKMIEFCQDEKRISFNPIEAVYKASYYCNSSFGNVNASPTSNDCLTASSYDMSKALKMVEAACLSKYPLTENGAYSGDYFECVKLAGRLYHPLNVWINGKDFLYTSGATENDVATKVFASYLYSAAKQTPANKIPDYDTILNLINTEYISTFKAAVTNPNPAPTDPLKLANNKRSYLPGKCYTPYFLGPLIPEMKVQDSNLSACDVVVTPSNLVFCPNEPDKNPGAKTGSSNVNGCELSSFSQAVLNAVKEGTKNVDPITFLWGCVIAGVVNKDEGTICDQCFITGTINAGCGPGFDPGSVSLKTGSGNDQVSAKIENDNGKIKYRLGPVEKGCYMIDASANMNSGNQPYSQCSGSIKSPKNLYACCGGVGPGNGYTPPPGATQTGGDVSFGNPTQSLSVSGYDSISAPGNARCPDPERKPRQGDVALNSSTAGTEKFSCGDKIFIPGYGCATITDRLGQAGRGLDLFFDVRPDGSRPAYEWGEKSVSACIVESGNPSPGWQSTCCKW